MSLVCFFVCLFVDWLCRLVGWLSVARRQFFLILGEKVVRTTIAFVWEIFSFATCDWVYYESFLACSNDPSEMTAPRIK
jgi:hypothetical protein